MEIKFFAAKYTKKIVLPLDIIDELPKNICIYTSIQFIEHLDDVVNQLRTAKKNVILLESKNYYYDGKKTRKGQLLGCNMEKIDDADAFLYIGDGLFHPKILMVKNEQPIFGYDPIADKWEKLDNSDIEKLKKKQKGAVSKFLMSNKIGVLVTTKPGQNLLNKSLKLKEKYPDKKFYYVLFNDINFGELENFPFVECWVNTACYRIGYDDTNKINMPIVNLFDLP